MSRKRPQASEDEKPHQCQYCSIGFENVPAKNAHELYCPANPANSEEDDIDWGDVDDS